MTSHASSSHVQQEAEPLILASLAEQEGLGQLAPRAITLAPRTRIEVDGCTADGSAVVEVYARQGRLKGAQLKKVAQDILKLALLRRNAEWAGARAIICFASREARDSVTGWVAHAAQDFAVELVVCDALPDELRRRIVRAQEKQIMVNAGDVADDLPDDVEPPVPG